MNHATCNTTRSFAGQERSAVAAVQQARAVLPGAGGEDRPSAGATHADGRAEDRQGRRRGGGSATHQSAGVLFLHAESRTIARVDASMGVPPQRYILTGALPTLLYRRAERGGVGTRNRSTIFGNACRATIDCDASLGRVAPQIKHAYFV